MLSLLVSVSMLMSFDCAVKVNNVDWIWSYDDLLIPLLLVITVTGKPKNTKLLLRWLLLRHTWIVKLAIFCWANHTKLPCIWEGNRLFTCFLEIYLLFWDFIYEEMDFFLRNSIKPPSIYLLQVPASPSSPTINSANPHPILLHYYSATFPQSPSHHYQPKQP